MLNIKSSLLFTVTFFASTFGVSSSAFAGEAGIAGSASFMLDNRGNVTEASVAVAVGKSSAYAGATTFTGEGTEAFAAGTGGQINLGKNSVYIQSIAEDTSLRRSQANELDNNDIDINVINGTANVDNTTIDIVDIVDIAIPFLDTFLGP